MARPIFRQAEFLRRQRGLTLTALSARVGIYVPVLSRLENGEPIPPASLARLAAFFGVRPAFLQEPVPPQLDPGAVAVAVEAEFAAKARHAAVAREPEQAPAPPSLHDAIRARRP